MKVAGVFRSKGMKVFTFTLLYTLFESLFHFIIGLEGVTHLFE